MALAVVKSVSDVDGRIPACLYDGSFPSKGDEMRFHRRAQAQKKGQPVVADGEDALIAA